MQVRNDKKQGNSEIALFILIGVFIGAMVISTPLGNKIIPMFFGLSASIGAISYTITFTATDVISEIWGKEKAKKVVLAAFPALVVALGLTVLALIWPTAPFWKNREAYNLIFKSSIRLILAGFVAYFIAQFHDIWAFHFWKVKTKGKHLWLRNSVSTSTSQFLDAVVFSSIAFYGTVPSLWMFIGGQFLFKIMITLLNIPLVYLLVFLVRKWESKK